MTALKATYTKSYLRIGPYNTKLQAELGKSNFRTGFLAEESERQFTKLKDKLLANFIADKVADSIKLLVKLRPLMTRIMILDYLSFVSDRLEVKESNGKFFLYAYHLAQ